MKKKERQKLEDELAEINRQLGITDKADRSKRSRLVRVRREIEQKLAA